MVLDLSSLSLDQACKVVEEASPPLSGIELIATIKSFIPCTGYEYDTFRERLFAFYRYRNMTENIVDLECHYHMPYGSSYGNSAHNRCEYSTTVDWLSVVNRDDEDFMARDSNGLVVTLHPQTYQRQVALERLAAHCDCPTSGATYGVDNIQYPPFEVLTLVPEPVTRLQLPVRTYILRKQFKGFVSSLLVAKLSDADIDPFDLEALDDWYYKDKVSSSVAPLDDAITTLFTSYGSLCEYRVVMLALLLRHFRSEVAAPQCVAHFNIEPAFDCLPEYYNVMLEYCNEALKSVNMNVSANIDTPECVSLLAGNTSIHDMLSPGLESKATCLSVSSAPALVLCGRPISKWEPFAVVTNDEVADGDEHLHKILRNELCTFLSDSVKSPVLADVYRGYIRTGEPSPAMQSLDRLIDIALNGAVFCDYMYNVYVRLLAHINDYEVFTPFVTAVSMVSLNRKISIPDYIGVAIEQYLTAVFATYNDLPFPSQLSVNTEFR